MRTRRLDANSALLGNRRLRESSMSHRVFPCVSVGIMSADRDELAHHGVADRGRATEHHAACQRARLGLQVAGDRCW